MEKHDPLDAAFRALADPTRRAIVARLTRGPAPVSALAQPFAMGLPAFLKHLRVLEEGGLVASEKQGRTRLCRITPPALDAAAAWLAEQRAWWEAQTDRLAALAETLTEDDRDAK